jgi:hypothetical protein
MNPREIVVLSGFGEAVAAERSWAWGMALIRRFLSGRIRITVPQQRENPETLQKPEPHGRNWSFLVEGTLHNLPKDHIIWLLTQDERSGQVWPQGFARVAYNPANQRWSGRIVATLGRRVRIVAVVAPPTSHDFFTYYQKHGFKTEWAPLDRIPAECSNQDFVQAVAPSTDPTTAQPSPNDPPAIMNKANKWYDHVAGDYLNYRLHDDDTEEATGGTIRLTRQSDASFVAHAFHGSGAMDWESEIQFDLEIQNVGVGYYLHAGKRQPDYGQQNIRYFPRDGCLQVTGINTSHGKTESFRHRWRRKV